MNRRKFIKSSIYSLASANILLSAYAENPLPCKHRVILHNKDSFLQFSKVWELLFATQGKIKIHGGAILSFINNKKPQKILVSIEADDFTILKKRLYTLDIIPIANFGLKKDCIEFLYCNTHFIINCTAFLKGKYLQTKYPFFRHDYLVYDINQSMLLDFVPNSYQNVNFHKIELLDTKRNDFDAFLLSHHLSALYSVPIAQESLLSLDYLNKEVCSLENSADTALKLIAIGDDIFQTEGLLNFKQIFSSLYVVSAFENWKLPISQFNNNIEKVYDIARDTEIAPFFVASSLLLLLVFERAHEITLHELPLTNEELRMSKDYINKFILARSFHSNPKFVSLFI